MLTYLGDLLETVVLPLGPKTKDEVFNTLPFFLLNNVGKNEIDDDNAVKTLKSSGTTTVMSQFTHIGTVVYKKGPLSLKGVQYLKDNAINEELDQAWKWEIIKSPGGRAAELASAHAHYTKFEFIK